MTGRRLHHPCCRPVSSVRPRSQNCGSKATFPIAFDFAMHAVTGPYASRLLEGWLGSSRRTVRNARPWKILRWSPRSQTFTYAHELAELVAPFGDAYRFWGPPARRWRSQTMVLGQALFVNPKRQPGSTHAPDAHLAPAIRRLGPGGERASCPRAPLWMWWPRSWAFLVYVTPRLEVLSATC